MRKGFRLPILALLLAAPAIADQPYVASGVACGYGPNAIRAMEELNRILVNPSEDGKDHPYVSIDTGDGTRWVKKPLEASSPVISETGHTKTRFMACSAVKSR